MKLTIVVPCYNEEAVLRETATRLQAIAAELRTQNVETQMLFVDDGSRDSTWSIIRELTAQSPALHGLKLAHNAGHQNALWAGLAAACGDAREAAGCAGLHVADAIVSIDADLQDDVNAIKGMVQQYQEEGTEVVLGVRRQRTTDTAFKRITAQGFYRFMEAMGAEVTYNHADFRLLSRRAAQALLSFPERNLFLRGMVSKVGFKVGHVYYDRAERFAGESKYPLKRMLSFALDGITSFSVRPLRIITFIGIFFLVVSLIGMTYALISKFCGHTTEGWTSILLSLWLIGGVIVTALGVIGEYIGKIYQEVKRRPRFIIESLIALALVFMPFTASAHSIVPIGEKTLTLAFTGDVMMGTNYPDTSTLPAAGGAHLFDAVHEVLCSADAAFGNLEGTLLNAGGDVKKCSNPSLCFAFRTPTAYVQHLVNNNYRFMSMANNHSYDFGELGIVSTHATLKEAGIGHAGIRGRFEYSLRTINGIRIGFCAFGHNLKTCSINDMEEVRKIIQFLRPRCQLLIVSMHGGGEGPKFRHVPHAQETCFGENRGNVEKFAHHCIDLGADVVFGHGPHVCRAMEVYKGHLIAYSLGNFCTPYRISLGGVSGYAPVLVAQIKVSNGTFVEGQIHSFIQQRGKGPQKDATNAVAAEIRALTLADFPHTPLQISPTGALKIKSSNEM